MDDKKSGGFASMDPDEQRKIASKGGKAVHAKGSARTFTSEEAKTAGKKGGEATSRNREHMSRLGQISGAARAARRTKDPDDEGPKAA